MSNPDSKAALADWTRCGDELLMAGDVAGAKAAYQQALALTSFFTRAPIISRLGLVEKSRANAMLRVLQAVEREFPDGDAFVGAGLAVWRKTSFACYDERLLAAMERHDALLPLPNWHWNLQTVIWAVRQARAIEGEFMELGVFRGHTTSVVAEYVNFSHWEKTWWLYDTFEGIPDDQLNQGWDQANRVYKGTFSHKEVSERFAAYSNIKVIKGRVPEVLQDQHPEKIAFIHMDLNSAVAEIAALDLLYDRLSPGGVVVFDDYCWRASVAQYNAEKKWFEALNERVLELPTGQGVFVKRP